MNEPADDIEVRTYTDVAGATLRVEESGTLNVYNFTYLTAAGEEVISTIDVGFGGEVQSNNLGQAVPLGEDGGFVFGVTNVTVGEDGSETTSYRAAIIDVFDDGTVADVTEIEGALPNVSDLQPQTLSLRPAYGEPGVVVYSYGRVGSEGDQEVGVLVADGDGLSTIPLLDSILDLGLRVQKISALPDNGYLVEYFNGAVTIDGLRFDQCDADGTLIASEVLDRGLDLPTGERIGVAFTQITEAGDLEVFYEGADVGFLSATYDLLPLDPDAPEVDIFANLDGPLPEIEPTGEPTEGDDVISLTNGDDGVFALGGDDTVFGRGGSDNIVGDDGNDDLRGGSQSDDIYGNDGDDRLRGNAGDDNLDGGAGNDDLNGGFGADYVYGEDGDDKLAGFDGDDFLFGGQGRDTLHGGDGDDRMNGDEGDDILRGAAGDDRMSGGDGNDSLYGGDDNDDLAGGNGDDLLKGGTGDDELRGLAGVDSLNGGAGADTINGGEGDDILKGGEGADLFEIDASVREIRFDPDTEDNFSVWVENDVGTDTVQDFEFGVDKVLISGLIDETRGTFTFEDLFLSQEDSAAIIQIGDSHMRLEGVDAADLSADDFEFDAFLS